MTVFNTILKLNIRKEKVDGPLCVLRTATFAAVHRHLDFLTLHKPTVYRMCTQSLLSPLILVIRAMKLLWPP